uniref:DDE-1 domain-containing protein n=1 Tax=Eutreptiella gymnastica TaxID=73025 RepID=A0A7S1I382_9EUGL|mmetsp:Transcript_125857/g.218143  ORF Transcript_125857/g.218143 Transcript_125857/m.218143 type:complete len:203 (+) Transcript_125857:186-794(+)
MSKYSKDVVVTFQKCGVIDTHWMLHNYLPLWGSGTGKRRFVIYDSASAHLTQEVKDAFAQANTSIAVIPGGLTPILQSLDCDFIYVYHHKYQQVTDEWACNNQNAKLNAAQRRILGTHFTAAAYKHAISVVDIASSFRKRGYLWPTSDGSHIELRELPGYKYDPTGALIWFRAKRVLEEDQAADQPPAKKLVQPSLMKLWQK